MQWYEATTLLLLLKLIMFYMEKQDRVNNEMLLKATTRSGCENIHMKIFT